MKRIIAFLLALVLSVGCTFGLTAIANEAEGTPSESAKPEIISQNVMYGGDFSLMFAVKASSVSGDEVTLYVYDEEPAESSEALWSKTISASSQTTDVKGIASYVFTTPGVAAKDMDKNFYIVAESAGVKSDVKKYSVAEYLYERLYDDNVAFGESKLEIAQKNLYLSSLEVGKNAQMLLFNYDNDPTNDRELFVTDLCYISLANVDGLNCKLDGGATKALVYKGEKLNLNSDAISFNGRYYNVGKFNLTNIVDPENVSTSTIYGTEIVAESHLVIEPAGLTATDNVPAPDTFDGTSYRTSFYTASNGSSTGTTASLVNVDGNNMLKFAPTDSAKNFEALFKLPFASPNAKKLVWEADVDFSNLAKGSETIFNNALYISIGSGYVRFNIHLTADGFKGYDNQQSGNSFKTFGSADHKIRLRVEYSETTNANGEKVLDARLFANGEPVEITNNTRYYATYSASKAPSALAQMSIYSSPGISGYYLFDNVQFYAVYSSPEEISLSDYYTFDDQSSVDTSLFSATKNPPSIVEGNDGNALKFEFTTAVSSESLNFYPIAKEDNANKVIFEYTFIDNYASATQNASTLLYFYSGSTRIYDFRFNNGKLLTAESNNISWAVNLWPGEVNTLRFELYMVGTKLVIDVYCNGQKVVTPSTYGSKITTVSINNFDVELFNQISRVQLTDGSNLNGYYLIDNVIFSKINTND